ncbi:MAG TPA: PilZ domain-containing protein [Lachnospiraceae bacterium]|nr:PilZ domain-containing protein [Lachnospiraceae bacterium]HBY71487.1 PilZ domain-containing protein [Lachnospiraceae bacterium]HCA70739.1 PilZ domain-containing protein [Lachnospiraceae bacterium]HCM14056.1 PilZ domain-containing protein [Lachnospiraceae bacterium]HCR40079.1 PilZ domain-containing protein [Lachnospiraceae bacterium]
MQERRKAKRMPVKLSLEISNLYKQDNEQVRNINAPIEVVNISKTGIGFQSESILPIGYYFNANINLNEEDTLHCVVKIIRSQPLEGDRKMYGCEFVGMAAILSYIFDEYDRKINQEE